MSAKLMRNARMLIERNSPQILTGLGVAGIVSTAVMTGYATVKAYDIIEAERGRKLMEAKKISEDVTYDDVKDICWQEKIKLCWKPYISPFLMGGASIACIIGAQSINTKRHAAIAGLYSLAESTLKDYQEKVIEQLGENKEQKIRDEVAQKRLNDNPVSKNEIVVTDHGETLCYDTISGRYFKSDIEKLRRIQNDLNHDLMGQMWVSLNDLYFVMGLEGIKLGEEIGWTVDELIDFRFSSKLTDTGEPCLVLDYDVTTKYRY